MYLGYWKAGYINNRLKNLGFTIVMRQLNFVRSTNSWVRTMNIFVRKEFRVQYGRDNFTSLEISPFPKPPCNVLVDGKMHEK